MRRTSAMRAIGVVVALIAATSASGGVISGRIAITGTRPKNVKVGYLGLPSSGRAITNMAGMTIGDFSGSVTCSTYKPREARLRWNPKLGLRFEHTELPPGRYIVWTRCDETYLDWRVVNLAPGQRSLSVELRCAAADQGDLVLVVGGKGEYNVRLSPLAPTGKTPMTGADVARDVGWDADVKGGSLTMRGMKAGTYRVDLRSLVKLGSAAGGQSSILKDAGTWSVQVVASKHREYKLTPAASR